MTSRRWPTPDELGGAPEIAIIAALEAILDLTLRALFSVHPQLGDDECPYWVRDLSPASEAADRILAAARTLADALEAYRGVVARRRDDPIETDPVF